MAEIEDEPMALRDRSFEQAPRWNHAEQRIGAAPRFGETREQETARCSGVRCADHCMDPVRRF